MRSNVTENMATQTVDEKTNWSNKKYFNNAIGQLEEIDRTYHYDGTWETKSSKHSKGDGVSLRQTSEWKFTA